MLAKFHEDWIKTVPFRVEVDGRDGSMTDINVSPKITLSTSCSGEQKIKMIPCTYIMFSVLGKCS